MIRLSKLGIAGAYLFLLLLCLWPVADLGSNVFPFQPGNIQWRYGALGLSVAGLKHFSALVTLALLGVGGWRTGGVWAEGGRSTKASETTAELLKAQQKD
jgi:hypothetical protein